MAGVDTIIKSGGAQAVAALAYGTQSVPAVDKIVGPGNIFVATAKRKVFGKVGIDMIAGPSEILVLADGTCDPAWVAADLLSQAEHDVLASPVLVTDSEALAKAVQAELEVQIPQLPRKEIARESVDTNGKMSESQLSRVMQDMADGDIQVLVCTTIIETGIDIPNVNTLIIEDADRMGLAQLHQIRGRIGRSPRRAYAYLTFRPGKILTEVAGKRLTAIREYVEFGSGFKIAMRDLEIRGAGNLLGPEQSGYMMSVGYDMYLKLLNDAVLEQQGKAAQIRPECSADLTVSAYIPDSYIPQAKQRMDLYRRIASIRTAADSGEILDELLDRFGDPPRAVTALLDVALLRSDAAQVGICDISQKGQQLIFRFTERVDPPSLLAVCSMASYKGRLLLRSGSQPYLTLYLKDKENSLHAAAALTEHLRLKQEEIQGQTPQTEGETT